MSASRPLPPFVAALDQGTTSSRALIVDGRGGVVCSASEELAQGYPRPGWAEPDPRALYDTTHPSLGARRARGAALRDRRRLAPGPADRRPRAPHGPDERFPHHALEPARGALGPGAAGAVPCPGVSPARGPPLRCRVRRDDGFLGQGP